VAFAAAAVAAATRTRIPPSGRDRPARAGDAHALLEQASILRFVEDNWSLGRLGDQSFDARAGSLSDLFDFRKRSAGALVLDPATGEPVR
jgi:hypothetical protein